MSIFTNASYSLQCDKCTCLYSHYVHDDKMDMDEWGWQEEFGSKKQLKELAISEGWKFFKGGKALCPGCIAKHNHI